MRLYSIISFLVLVSACQKDDVRPLMRTEAEIGEPFIISSPAEVAFKESGLILHITFGTYSNFGSVPSNTKAVIRYDNREIDLYHGLSCDDRDCEGYTHDENTFSEEAKLDELYTLEFSKIVASTMVKDYGDGKKEFRVDSAQFVLKTN